jgi:hypothetical protein
MSAHSRAIPAVGTLRTTQQFPINVGRSAIASAFILLLAGCTNPPPYPLAGPDPSDPGARVPKVTYRSTIGPYTSQRPVEPAPWRERSERPAPAPKP